MTAINHALTGALLGIAVSNPSIAIPLAILSHFVLDALPHYGSNQTETRVMRSNMFVAYLVIEAMVCFVLVLTLAVLHPFHWQIACICAFLAAAPDLLSYNRFNKIRQGKQWHGNLYSKFAQNIQWFQKPVGSLVEITWFGSAVFLLAKLV